MPYAQLTPAHSHPLQSNNLQNPMNSRPTIYISLLIISTFAPGLSRASQPYFIDVTDQAGLDFVNVSGGKDKHYIIETQSAGGGFWDYDNDGVLDLYLTNGAHVDSSQLTTGTALYRGLGDATFTNSTAASGARLDGWTMGVAFADYDGDGNTDLYATRWGPDALLRNNGNSTLSEATTEAGLGSPGWSIGAAFSDYDLDGDLDLYVANYIDFELKGPPFYERWCTHNGIRSACGPVGARAQPDLLYRNEGDGRFTDIGRSQGIGMRAYYGMGVAWTDYDGDGDPDVYVANDGQPNSLFRNDNGHFTDVALFESVAYSGDGRPQAGMGLAVSDYDNNGLFDLFATNFSQDHNTLYHNSGQGFFADMSGRAGLAGSSRPYMGWGTFFFDFDHDGHEDLFVANGHLMPAIDQAGVGQQYRQPNQLYHNKGNGKFIDLSTHAGPGLQVVEVSRGAAYGDYDTDGDLDILVANLDAAPTLLRNDSRAQGHWLSLRLRGEGLNLEAIGARVRLTAGDLQQQREVRTGTSFQSQHSLRLHFGLATEQSADIEIRWPDGSEQIYRAIKADAFYTIDKEQHQIIAE
jgi:hypothetical protein